MRKSLTTLAVACLTLIATPTMAQTAFPALGGDANSSTGSLSYTVGQVETQGIYTSVSGNRITGAAITEGVQQTYPEKDLGIEEITHTDFSVSVYPNPTSTGVVAVELAQYGYYTNYELYASNGKLVQSGTLQSDKQKIDLSGCTAGTYVLRISNNETGRTYSFRIIKMH
ncbi:MAG: T9SS type A sorting domain-containing protein [Bacteroidales bacterium]|nr:T9SS type A sorting domain-containing protein [Bacteroidales bacterium]